MLILTVDICFMKVLMDNKKNPKFWKYQSLTKSFTCCCLKGAIQIG